MLRLLKKSEIDSAKVADQQRLASEGMKLAKRVDNLRETAADEEAALSKFRVETISHINAEILLETKKKNLLVKEVSDLEDRKRIALVPLDEEWQKVNIRKDELTEYAVSLNEDKSLFEDERKDFEVETERLAVEKKRIEAERKQSVKSLAQAEEYRENSSHALKEAEAIRGEAEQFKKLILQEVSQRDAEAAAKERDLNIREEYLMAREMAVTKKEQEVNDKYETLLRTTKRNGKRI